MLRASLKVLLALLLGLSGGRAWSEEQAAYNVVLLVASDLGAEDLGCYGHSPSRTPHLDALAAEGMRFLTCWATPLATPSRAMLLSGAYAWRTGYFQDLGKPLTPTPESPLHDFAACDTLPDVLDRAGWATAMAGSWHLPGRLPDLVQEHGFDTYRMYARRQDLPRGVEHTGGWENDRRTKTSRYWNPCILEGGAYTPTTVEEYGPDLFAEFSEAFLRRRHGAPTFLYHSFCLTSKPRHATPDPQGGSERIEKGDHAATLAYLDHVVGRLLAALEASGEAERTVVVFTSGGNGRGKGKRALTEKGVWVPLLVRAPSLVAAGSVSRALVSLADLYPTLLELGRVGAPLGREADGRSLVAVLRGDEGADEAHRPHLVSYLGEHEMARDDRWILDGAGALTDDRRRRTGGRARYLEEAEDEEALAARARLQAALGALPGPDAIRGDLIPEKRPRGAR